MPVDGPLVVLRPPPTPSPQSRRHLVQRPPSPHLHSCDAFAVDETPAFVDEARGLCGRHAEPCGLARIARDSWPLPLARSVRDPVELSSRASSGRFGSHEDEGPYGVFGRRDPRVTAGSGPEWEWGDRRVTT